MPAFTAADAVSWVSRTIGRPVDVVIANEGHPSDDALARYRAEHKQPLAVGNLPAGCEMRERPVLAIGHRPSQPPPAVVRGVGGAQPPSVEVTGTVHRFRPREERHEIAARHRHPAVARRSVARAGAGEFRYEGRARLDRCQGARLRRRRAADLVVRRGRLPGAEEQRAAAGTVAERRLHGEGRAWPRFRRRSPPNGAAASR